MPGPNTTGLPNTADYSLGRGIVYFAPLSNGLPTGYRDLGNCTEFNISIEVETVEHQSSRQGLRVVDKEVVISQKMTLTLSLDELNHENLALFFSGEKATHTNPSVAGQAKYEWLAAGVVELGRHYNLVNASGERAYDCLGSDITIEQGATTLVEDTDYTVDEEFGTIFFLSTASNLTIPDTDGIDLTIAAEATASAVNEVQGLKSSSVTGALKFISVNPANNDARTEYEFHQVALKPSGDFGLISDEFTTMQLEGAAESNATFGGADSPTLTIRNVVA